MRTKSCPHIFPVKASIPILILLAVMFGKLLAQGPPVPVKRFHALSPQESGVGFSNALREDSLDNFFRYMNFYNGGGVAMGDVNNDGLPDLLLTANQQANRLYLNQGNLRFQDITETAGVSGPEYWSNGVTLADVNADGWLDIYVCQAGNYANPGAMRNLLYINNQDLTFTERAADYGIADAGRSVQATFFDADGDLDLDLYVVNHPDNFHLPLGQRIASEQQPNWKESDHFYRNDGGKFVEATDAAGLRNWAFGLSVTAGDLNGDGRVDLYVACDFSEPDYYWLNQGDGTFRNQTLAAFLHISNFSMGADIGDWDNDGLPDLVVVDMMSKDNRKSKTNMSGMNPEAFWDNVDQNRHYQYMQNVLQHNNGNGTFSDLAELAGVARTDWSWSPLFADLDNDGWKDLLITNGIRRDVRNNDYAKKLRGASLAEVNANWEALIKKMPVEAVANFCFQNTADLGFRDQSADWGLDLSGFSTGMAVGDLDGDGDLDIVLNNVDGPATVYENNSVGRALRIRPRGPASNPFGLGLKAKIVTDQGIQFQELTLTRGFLSASEPILHFGTGPVTAIHSLELTWPDGQQQRIPRPAVSGEIIADYRNASSPAPLAPQPTPLLAQIPRRQRPNFQAQEAYFDDFAREVLLPHKYSQLGPFMATADVNADGLDDLFVGGPAGQSGQLFLRHPDGSFLSAPQQPWAQHAAREDMGACFFDADGDGDPDLYIASGSNEFAPRDARYGDRLYHNDGRGRWSDASQQLPGLKHAGSCVHAADFDADGDLDLFVGGRLLSGNYPQPGTSTLLLNEGGKFRDATAELAPGLAEIGMVTDASWTDVDGDGDPDLMVVGEWMAPTLFRNVGGKFVNATASAGLSAYTGWWYALQAADLDADGDLDFIAGNLGLNSKYQASAAAPFQVYAGDLDANGKSDIVLAYAQDGKTFPVRGRQCSSEQIPSLTKKFPTYDAFGNAGLSDIYGSVLGQSLHYSATWMATSYLENKGDGTFAVRALPNAAQVSTVNGIAISDLNADGHPDLVLAGNMFHAEVETARHDASIGSVLLGDGQGNFAPLGYRESGLFAHGDVKDVLLLKGKNDLSYFVISRNQGPLQVYQLRK